MVRIIFYFFWIWFFKGNLKRHLKFKHGKIQKEELFSCQLCERDFQSRRELDRHTQSQHLTERQYACDFCNATFHREDHFLSHVLLHNEESRGRRDVSFCELCHVVYDSELVHKCSLSRIDVYCFRCRTDLMLNMLNEICFISRDNWLL